MSLFEELKRRNVIRVAIAYSVIGWVLAQVAEFAFENFGAPDWVLKSVIVILLLGLPIAIVFAWAFEMTPEGIKREKEVDRSQSITPQTGKKLDRVIIAVLVVALAWFAWDKFGGSPEPAATATEASVSDKSVAVLPFVAMSNGPDVGLFIQRAGHTNTQIAEALGVQHVVEGSVRRSGDRLRATAQLIRANDGFHLWSETFDSTSEDMIEVQENIAEDIAIALVEGVTEAIPADAYATAIADLEAAARYAPTKWMRYIAELDLELLRGNWRGLSGRVERALAELGCLEGNWTPTIVNILGVAGDYAELSTNILACDPLRTLSWFNLSRAKLWAGDTEEALRVAREGTEVAPGAWLTMTMVQALVSSGLYDEALRVIENDVSDVRLAYVFQILVAAHQGDKEGSDQLLAEFNENNTGDFFDIIIHAWSGNREEANRRAAKIDEHFFGPMVLWQIANWCQCGSPWEPEAAPNFAAKINEANIAWPPRAPLSFPLKDW
jgi:TolB-like protein